MQNPVDHETSSTACHAGIHIGTSSTLSLGPSSFSVKWSETQAWHFPSMRDFRFEWSWALKLLCAVPLSWTMVVKMEILGEILRCHVSWFFVRPTCLAENPVDCETLSTACHAGLHIGISSIQSSSVPQALLQSEVGRSRHFPPMRILDFTGYGPLSSCIKCPLAGQWLSKWKPFERRRTSFLTSHLYAGPTAITIPSTHLSDCIFISIWNNYHGCCKLFSSPRSGCMDLTLECWPARCPVQCKPTPTQFKIIKTVILTYPL